MPSQWLFPRSALLATPSASTSAISLDKELYDRARGVEFLYRLGSSLYLPASAMCTAATWFHRFYMRFSLEDYHRQDVAAACIFLATKTEECGRKLRDIAKVYQSKVTAAHMEQLSQDEIERCQDAILATEEALLEALCFDFVVDSPHEYLVDLFDRHKPDEHEGELKDSAWSIAHDSYRTVLCVLFEARIIAAACFILAQRLVEGPNSPSLDARIASTAPSASLPTPPSNKPSTPDASRFAVLQLQFSEEELRDLAEALAILIEFYGAQDTLGPLSYVTALSTIPIPTLPESREQLYRPRSHMLVTASAQNGLQSAPNMSHRTPESIHEGGSSPAKPPNHGCIPVQGQAKNGDIPSNTSRAKDHT